MTPLGILLQIAPTLDLGNIIAAILVLMVGAIVGCYSYTFSLFKFTTTENIKMRGDLKIDHDAWTVLLNSGLIEIREEIHNLQVEMLTHHYELVERYGPTIEGIKEGRLVRCCYAI